MRTHRTYVGWAKAGVTDLAWVARCYHCPWESPPQARQFEARDLADRHEQRKR